MTRPSWPWPWGYAMAIALAYSRIERRRYRVFGYRTSMENRPWAYTVEAVKK